MADSAETIEQRGGRGLPLHLSAWPLDWLRHDELSWRPGQPRLFLYQTNGCHHVRRTGRDGTAGAGSRTGTGTGGGKGEGGEGAAGRSVRTANCLRRIASRLASARSSRSAPRVRLPVAVL